MQRKNQKNPILLQIAWRLENTGVKAYWWSEKTFGIMIAVL